jgi:hypothetical protein
MVDIPKFLQQGKGGSPNPFIPPNPVLPAASPTFNPPPVAPPPAGLGADFASEGFDAEADPIVVSANRLKSEDQRIRLKPFTNARNKVLGDNDPENILHPLYATNGVLFPYTPTIQFNQDVDWKTIEVTHSNYETAAYSRTPAVSLSLTGKFTVQTHAEGRYLLAVLHFFRVVSKMYFGRQHVESSEAGVPPPVLLLKGYGDYMFNDLRVIVKNHTYTIDDTVNLVQVKCADGAVVTLPAVLTLSCTLQMVQGAKAQKDEFNLDQFRTGALMRGGGGWI